jgi:hypothetical protein
MSVASRDIGHVFILKPEEGRRTASNLAVQPYAARNRVMIQEFNVPGTELRYAFPLRTKSNP